VVELPPFFKRLLIAFIELHVLEYMLEEANQAMDQCGCLALGHETAGEGSKPLLNNREDLHDHLLTFGKMIS
jgi:hypothetical protein